MTQKIEYKAKDKCIVTAIGGDANFKSFMLSNGISIGTVISINYSPGYAQLINITVGTKMLVFKKEDFHKLSLEKLKES